MKMTEKIKIIQTNELDEKAKQQAFHLWNNEYSENLSYNSLAEFDKYLENLTQLKHYLLTFDTDQILGWAWTFDREREKWFAIILSEEIQGKGFGRKILNELKQVETVLNGWVVDHSNYIKKNGLPYISPLKFYQKCGFKILTDVRLELDSISAVKILWTKEME